MINLRSKLETLNVRLKTLLAPPVESKRTWRTLQAAHLFAERRPYLAPLAVCAASVIAATFSFFNAFYYGGRGLVQTASAYFSRQAPTPPPPSPITSPCIWDHPVPSALSQWERNWKPCLKSLALVLFFALYLQLSFATLGVLPACTAVALTLYFCPRALQKDKEPTPSPSFKIQIPLSQSKSQRGIERVGTSGTTQQNKEETKYSPLSCMIESLEEEKEKLTAEFGDERRRICLIINGKKVKTPEEVFDIIDSLPLEDLKKARLVRGCTANLFGEILHWLSHPSSEEVLCQDKEHPISIEAQLTPEKSLIEGTVHLQRSKVTPEKEEEKKILERFQAGATYNFTTSSSYLYRTIERRVAV